MRNINGVVVYLVMVVVYLTSSVLLEASTIGSWSFEESSGTNVTDSSANSNDGTMYNMDPATDRVAGKVGNALDFDGVDDYVDCGSDSSLLPSGSFTVSAWIYSRGYVNNGSTYNVPLARGNPLASGDAGGYGFAFGSNNELIFSANGVGVSSGIDISNRWVYAVGVYDSEESRLKIYINGVLKRETFFGGLGTDTKNFYIGRDGCGTLRLFNGLVDEVQIYDNALSNSEIQENYIKGSAIGEWRFEDGLVTTVNDSSDNSNDGTMYNMNPATDRVAGKVGNALDFDGVDDYVDCGNDSSLLPSGSFTVSAWMYSRGYVNNGSSYNVAVARGNPFSQGGGYGFAIDSTETLRFVGNNARALSGVDIKDRWVYAVGVYDSEEGKLKIYIDGVLEGETSCNGLGTDTQNVYIGRDSLGYLRSFNGLIDEVRVYDNALSSRMIFQNYTKGNIIASWHLNEGSGSNAADASLNTNNGTLTNMNLASCWKNSRVGNALDFDGVDDYVDCGNDSSLLPNGSFSVSAWIYSRGYVSNGSAYNLPLSRGNPFSDAGGYGFAFTSDEKLRFVAGNTIASSDIDIKDRWVYAVGVYNSDEGKLKIYIDGVLKGETSFGGLGTDTQSFHIGKGKYSNRMFNGLVDEVQIYNIALTPRPFATFKTWHNNDLINVAGWFPQTPVTNATLDANFDSVAGKVDVHLLSPGMGWVPMWDSDVYNAAQHYTDWEIATGNTCDGYGAYMKAEGDILQEFINRCRVTGQSPFASIRLNDYHFMEYLDPENSDDFHTQIISDFCWDHIDDILDPLNLRSGFNWAVPALPAQKLAFIEEICENYDIDGIELDFLRGYNYFDQEETTSDQRREIMNKFVSDVRAILDETADEGQYRWLTVRIPCFLSVHDAIGLDIESLAAIGVDVFNASPYFPNIQQTTDIKKIRRMIPNKCLLYELEFFSFTTEGGYGYYGRVPTPDEQLYTTANLMYKHGVDGIEWFNFDYFPQFGISKPYYLLENVADREWLANRTQQWYFQAGNSGWLPEMSRTYSAGTSYTFTLDLALSENLATGDGLFRLMTDEDCSGCSWSVSINGQALSSTSFVSKPIDHPYSYTAMTDSTRYSSFLVPQAILHDGINLISIKMNSGSTQILRYFDLALPPDN